MKKEILYTNTVELFSKDDFYNFINSFTFKPNRFGHHENNPKASCSDRIIGDFELIYTIGGQGYIKIGETCYDCKAGDLVLIPPFTKHRIQSSETDPHNNYWFHFDVLPYYRQKQFINAIMPSGENYMHIGLDDELTSLLVRLESENTSRKPGFRIFLNTILLQIITSIIRKSNPNGLINKDNFDYSAGNWVIDKCIQYINDNISQKIRISDLSEYVHASESCIYKNFMKFLNMSPNEFIQLVKIKYAEQLLKTTSLTITEISEKLGYSSPFYFSRIFKKYFFMSPSDCI